MKIIKQDLKKGQITVKVENLDDLWYLSHIIDKKDLIKGKTSRKIKLSKEDERKQQIIKKTVTLKLKIEKIELSKDLRLSGTIIQGPEDVQKGVFHTFNIEENSIITIEKEKWLKFQIDRLKEASKEISSKILIIALERDFATFALLKKYGFDILTELEGEVEKKQQNEKIKTNFYSEITKQIEFYDKKYNFSNIIIGSPAFWKDDLLQQIKNSDLSKKITLASCSSTEKNAINEILKRDEIKKVLKQDRIQKEINLIEELFIEISKNNLSAYGFKEVKEAAEVGAIKTLLITDKLIQKLRDEDNYEDLDNIMKQVEKTKGEIHIISTEHEAGKRLQGLKGLGAILRFKLKY